MKKFAWIIVVSALAGCVSTKPKAPGKQVAPPEATAPMSSIDPCATRLHDLCETFLLYYAVQHQMPQRIEQLQKMFGPNDAIPFVCPETEQPYTYNPQGLIIGSSRIVLYDSVPAHNGIRWAISINQPKGNGALIAEVIGVPESRFAGVAKPLSK